MANYFTLVHLTRLIDYYGVTFDHLVPADDTNPEVLQINIIEIEEDNGVYAKYVAFICSRSGRVRWEEGTSSAEMLPEEKGNTGSLASECTCGPEGLRVRSIEGSK
jgi:hypothetical protein